nr:hypothetical protein [Tanacetum cinerariifolium]
MNSNDSVAFDKTKVECFNCHKRGHFERECRAPRGHDNKSKDVTRKTVPIETPNSSALVSCDGLGGYDWSDQAEEGLTNYTLMAYSTLSASSLDSKSKDKSTNVEPKSVRKDSDALIIEDWVSDDEEEMVEKKEVKPSINKINFVKATTDNNPRETVQYGEQPKQNTHRKRVNAAKAKVKHKVVKGKKGNAVKALACWAHDREHVFLIDYKEIDGGYVAFGGNPKRGKITGKDGKKIVINEASIRHDLKFNDAEGTSYLSNAVIVKELARMGYEKPSEKLTFYKVSFHLNGSSSFIPFYNRKHEPRKKEKKETKVSPTEIHIEDHVPTTSIDLLHSGKDRMQLKELMDLCTNLLNKVLDLENKVIEMNSSYKVKIAELESRVEKLEEENRSLIKELKSFNTRVESPAIKETVIDKEESFKYGRKIADIDVDAEVNLENVYNLDMAREETVLSMQDVDVQSERINADVKEVAEEMFEVIEIAKIIVDEVSTVGGELNAANEEPDNAEKQKLEEQEEVEELKKNLEIVPDDEDDLFVNVIPSSSNPSTIVDYKIYNVGKREYF